MSGKKPITNKKLGSSFEQEMCDLLSKRGFWVHFLNGNKDGQPADIIAVKGKKAFLIDCKVCSNKGFNLERIAENQRLAMELWKECGNGEGLFALKITDGRIFIVDLKDLLALSNKSKYISNKYIAETFARWELVL